jgi:plasmid stabilization system protein ParE
MPTLKSHPLVGADFQSAYGWYEDECGGLGMEFANEFRAAYQRLRRGPLLYAVRFSGIRRLNLDRFPYGIFYSVHEDEVRVLAVLHGSRETRTILAERRRAFFGNRI